MALREKRAEAMRMRIQGASYSQIKQKLGVSKSSLSLWLRDYPLSEAQMSNVRDNNPRRIERCRETKRKKKADRLACVYNRAVDDLGCLSNREVFIAGLFLYWGEGGKTREYITTLSNTDPAMMAFFIRWLELFGISKNRLRVVVHLYEDMDTEAELKYWSETLSLPRTVFRKPYIKKSNRSEVTYTQRFTHGTCNVMYGDRDLSEYVLTALEAVRSKFADRIDA